MRRALALLLLLAVACSGGGDDSAITTTTTAPRRTTTSTTTTTEPEEPTTTTASTIADPRLLAPSFPPLIGGLGDSLLAGAEPDIKAQLDDTRYSGEGQQGQKIQGAGYRLELLLPDRPAATAVVLGTNNAQDGLDAEDLPAIDQLMVGMSRLPCVRWVEVTTSTGDPVFDDAARAINAELHRLADTYTNIDVVAWADIAAAHPEWHVFDHVHHTPDGAAAFADVILDALARCSGTLIRR